MSWAADRPRNVHLNRPSLSRQPAVKTRTLKRLPSVDSGGVVVEAAQPADGPNDKTRKILTTTTAHALYPTAENEWRMRPIWLGKHLLCDVIIGYTGGTEDDPAQSGVAPDRQSGEIKTLSFASVNKERRHELIRGVGARPGRRQDASEKTTNVTERRKYTWIVEEVAPSPGSASTLTPTVATCVARVTPRSSFESARRACWCVCVCVQGLDCVLRGCAWFSVVVGSWMVVGDLRERE